MRISLFAFALLPLVAFPSIGQTKPSQRCLPYEPEVVRLTGKLVRQTFPGPPNYESVAKGDRPETYWLLDLSVPACVDEDKANPDLNPQQTGIRRVQLVLQPEMYVDHKALVGERVSIQGTLFGAHTGHHHTTVLMTVKALEKATP